MNSTLKPKRMPTSAFEMAPLSDFKVIEHLPKRKMQVTLMVYLRDFDVHHTIDNNTKVVTIHGHKPKDLDVFMERSDIRDGWTMVWLGFKKP
jgi:hypothetical protein